MRAFAIDRFGEEGTVRELAVPEPEEGQVRIRVEAAGLNPADALMMSGVYKDFMPHRFPLVPGMDVSGVVDAVGGGITAFRSGDPVFGGLGKTVVGEGAVAEYAIAAVSALLARPAAIDAEFAAALPLSGVAALTMLEAAALRPGDTVLAVGAAGGVGGYAVQLAAAAGARVIAVSRGVHHQYLRGLGAAETVDYEAQDVREAVRALVPEGLAAILDMVGDKRANNRLADVIRQGGRLVSIFQGADAEALGALGVEGVNARAQVDAGRLAALAGRVDAGELKRPEIRAFSLEEAAAAYRLLATRHVQGKLVVRP